MHQAAALAVLLLAATGCQVRLAAGIEVREDGSGIVQAAIGLDAEALRELGDPARRLRVGDLRDAGWDVTGPDEEADGLTWVRATKRFASPAEAAGVASELSGPGGPLREFKVRREQSLWRTTTTFSGLVDLTDGLAGLADPEVVERLGSNLGLDLAGLRQRFGDGLGDAIQVRVTARLPGRSQTWRPALGETLSLLARSSSWRPELVLPAAGSLVFAAAALVGVARAGRRRPGSPL